MTSGQPSLFNLPDRHRAKGAPDLIGRDEAQFAAIAASVTQQVAELSRRRDTLRKAPGREGQEALDRDLEIHRLTARLNLLQRYGPDLCLGRVVRADDSEPEYIGRIGLTDHDGRRLLVDWRSPAAEPFFAATLAEPMGLTSRRRYHSADGRVSDYWDEALTSDTLPHSAALDDESAFITSLGAARSDRMRDVLATIAADQDAVIRAGSQGTLVVDGGPGTGKTVVALHRSAYLLYADPRLGHRRGGLLFIGPHQPYLAYVADVLPSLGEEGVLTATLRDLVPEGSSAGAEADPRVARLKAEAELIGAIEPAVGLYEEPPSEGLLIQTPVSDVWCGPADWAVAFEAVSPGEPHNEARDAVWDELITLLVDKHPSDEAPPEVVRRSLERNEDLVRAFDRAWPILEAPDIVADLWTVPAYLRRCAPWLTPEQVRLLQRTEAYAWTVADLPLLDAARLRLGDPQASRRRRRERAEAVSANEEMDRVIDHLIESDDSDMAVMSMLRGHDLRGALAPQTVRTRSDLDRLAGPFAHIVVDEAQELTDAEWQMLLARCPSRSLTVVGDRAQARAGFTESWQERLARVGLGRAEVATLTVNYRTPKEVMDEAEPVIRSVLPDASVPISIRRTGQPVLHGSVGQRDAVLATWLAENPEGIACVIGDPTFRATDRVRSQTPALAKGLEFDLVVLVDPPEPGTGVEAVVDRYVAMTRATGRLAILTSP